MHNVSSTIWQEKMQRNHSYFHPDVIHLMFSMKLKTKIMKIKMIKEGDRVGITKIWLFIDLIFIFSSLNVIEIKLHFLNCGNHFVTKMHLAN